jgi:hypothetical protein
MRIFDCQSDQQGSWTAVPLPYPGDSPAPLPDVIISGVCHRWQYIYVVNFISCCLCPCCLCQELERLWGHPPTRLSRLALLRCSFQKEIIDRRIQDFFPGPKKDRKADHYLVVWEVYPLKKDYTWEPIENLYGHEDLAQTYEQWLKTENESLDSQSRYRWDRKLSGNMTYTAGRKKKEKKKEKKNKYAHITVWHPGKAWILKHGTTTAAGRKGRTNRRITSTAACPSTCLLQPPLLMPPACLLSRCCVDVDRARRQCSTAPGGMLRIETPHMPEHTSTGPSNGRLDSGVLYVVFHLIYTTYTGGAPSEEHSWSRQSSSKTCWWLD